MTIPSNRRRAATLILVAWAVPSLLGAMGRILEWRAAGREESVWIAVLNGVMPWTTWMLFTPFVVWAARRFPVALPLRTSEASRDLDRRAGARRLGRRSLFVHLALSLLVGLVFVSVGVVWYGYRTETPIPRAYVNFLPLVYPLSTVLYGVVVLSVSWLDATRRWREQALAATRAEAQLTRARLDALQARLRPHFLFNTLHSISAMIRTAHPDRALTMVAQLGDLLRRVIDVDQRPEITLASELELVHTYLAIERERFADRLTVSDRVPTDVGVAMVPSLLLQPIVENAILHGVAPVARSTTLELRARREGEDLIVEVVNDGAPYDPGDGAPGDGAGVGLRNVRDRLKELYGSHAAIELSPREHGGCRVTVRLPWRENGADR